LVAAALGPERRELLDRIQATMALIEGHAEHVMDAAAVDVLPDLERLRAQLDRRRRERSTANPLLRLLERLLGVEMKLRQYEAGKRFCDAVVQRGGIDALNRAWSGPEALPTWAELGAPERWLARV
jgi:putative hydrolase